MCTGLNGLKCAIIILYSLLRSMKEADEYASAACKIFFNEDSKHSLTYIRE